MDVIEFSTKVKNNKVQPFEGIIKFIDAGVEYQLSFDDYMSPVNGPTRVETDAYIVSTCTEMNMVCFSLVSCKFAYYYHPLLVDTMVNS